MKRLGRVARWARNVLAVVGAFTLIYHAFFDVSEMISPSMSPTLAGDGANGANDIVLSEKISYWLRSPRRWEIVRFRSDEGSVVMKRVVALPGETVSINEKSAVVNGAALSRPQGLSFLAYYPYGKLRSGQTMACGNGYFVLGDDSKDSQDSRYEGPVDPHRIAGRAWAIVWPPSRMRFVNP